MTTGPAPLCWYCKHYRPGSETFTCDAFPQGIPEEIIGGAVQHTVAYPEDKGIRFEALPDSEDAVQAILELS